MTPRSLIESALRAIGTLATGESPTDAQMQDGMELFNLMLDSWSAEGLLPDDMVQTNFSLTASRVNYTIGDGAAADSDGVALASANAAGTTGNLDLTGAALVTSGVATMDIPRHASITSDGNDADGKFTVTGTNIYGDVIEEVIGDGTSTGPSTSTVTGTIPFNTVTQIAIDAASTGAISAGSGAIIDTRRPVKIVDAFNRTSAGADTPVTVMDRERYNQIADKDETSTVPKRLYYDRLYNTGEIYIAPVPAASGNTLYIDMWQPFVQITTATLDIAIKLPGEYILAFRWILAAELAPEYGKNVSDYVFQRAIETKNVIKTLNAMPPKPLSSAMPTEVIAGQPAVRKD